MYVLESSFPKFRIHLRSHTVLRSGLLSSGFTFEERNDTLRHHVQEKNIECSSLLVDS